MSGTRHRPGNLRQRFRVLPYPNPRTGSASWRVYGIKRDGTIIRENHQDAESARLRQLELETEYHGADATQGSALRATRLTDHAIRIAETAFARLDQVEDLLAAVDHWLRHGRHQHRPGSPNLDDALAQFKEWMRAEGLRPLT